MGKEPLRYGDLAGIDRPILWGLIAELGDPVWGGTYEYRWERARYSWNAVQEALRAAATGTRPARPVASAPSYLGRVVRTQIEDLATRTHAGAFTDIRVLERLELVELDHDDQYVLAIVGGLAGRLAGTTRIDELHADPDLIPELWRLFEVEGGGEVSLANVDKFIVRRESSWEKTFQLLVGEGSLPRDRVLTSCLDALLRDFNAYRARWYSSLYDALTPSPAELTAHQDRLRNVLGSSVTASVSLAARSLRQVSRSGELDDAACGQLVPGLLGRTKGPALDVLRILDDVARRSPGLSHVVVATAEAGLEHPQAEVQQAAALLLITLGARERVVQAADQLAPSVRHHLKLDAPSEPPAADQGTITPAAMPIDAAVPPLRAPSGREVTEQVAAMLEGSSDPVAIELALAGLARLARDDERTVLASLVQRVTQLSRRPGGLAGRGATVATFSALVVAASLVNGTQHELDQIVDQIPAPPGPGRLLAARAGSVASMLIGLVPPTDLLALPAGPRMWIDPPALATRLEDPSPFTADDLVAALLRLGDRGRAEASGLVTRTDEAGQALRYALGGPAPAHRPAIVTPAIWVAASRARSPRDDDPFLVAAALSGAGQGRPVIAHVEAYRWSCRVEVEHPAVTSDPLQPTAIAGSPRLARGDSSGSEPFPADDTWEGPGYTPLEWIPWVAATYPHDAEPAFTGFCAPVARGFGGIDASGSEIPGILSALAEHPGHLGISVAATLAAALAADRAEHRVLAVDAAAAQATRGTLTPELLARGMGVFAATVTLPRWATSLAELAGVLGSPFVPAVLTRLLPEIDQRQRGLGSLLEVLLDESLRLGLPAGDPGLRAHLETFTGSSRTARAARDLLKL